MGERFTEDHIVVDAARVKRLDRILLQLCWKYPMVPEGPDPQELAMGRMQSLAMCPIFSIANSEAAQPGRHILIA